jgi:hypothetical protein
VDCNRRTIFIADAHRDGQRFIVHADEKLTAFVELETVTRGLPRFETALLAKTFGVQTRLHFPDQKWVRLCFSNTNAITAQSVVIATIRFDESGRPPNAVWV